MADRPLCDRCRAAVRPLGAEPLWLGGVETWAAVAYEGPVRALVAGLKFRGAAGLASPLAAQILAAAPPRLLAPGTALVPVPLHPARARRRGYNQAERIAAAIARRSGLAVVDCLRRSGPAGARQLGRDRSERLAGIAGAIGMREGRRCPARAVLVDDVVTTGATLSACAVALMAAGTVQVAAIAYARTQGR